jgi:hypothetical protein
VVAVEQDFTVESVTVGGDLLNVPVMAGEIRAQYPERFNLLDHTVQNRTPLMAVAFPRQLFSELGLRFDESLPVCEDWDLLLRSALICGVADAPEATALYRRWDSGDSSLIMHSEREWIDAATSIQAKLDRSPLTLPPGYLTQIRALVSQGSEQVAQLTAQLQVHSIALQATDQRLLEVFGSTSWRVTRPLRGASRALRFVKRKMRVRH